MYMYYTITLVLNGKPGVIDREEPDEDDGL